MYMYLFIEVGLFLLICKASLSLRSMGLLAVSKILKQKGVYIWSEFYFRYFRIVTNEGKLEIACIVIIINVGALNRRLINLDPA